MVASGATGSTSCPRCGLWTDAERKAAFVEATRAHYAGVYASELDLNDAQFQRYRSYKALFPDAHKKTLIAWVDGEDYDPWKDEEFLREVEALLGHPPTRSPSYFSRQMPEAA